MKLAFLFATLAGTVFAQTPIIAARGIVNHFSLALPGMPNGGIAQGSLFEINGTNLGPKDAVAADLPLGKVFGGVSAQVTVGGRTVDVLVTSVSAARIVALLPSSTPLGTGTLIVTVNGVKSAAAPITVVKTSVGIQSVNPSGSGAALMNISDGAGGLVPNSQDVTIQPGQTAVFYGTGAGAVTFDESNAAPMQPLDLDMKAYVGTVEAQIVYIGRAPGQAGIDEFDVIIPEGVTGCYAGVTFVAANLISNPVSIAIGDGGPCPGANSSLPDTGSLRYAAIEIVRSMQKVNFQGTLGIVDIISDIGTAVFGAIDYSKIVRGGVNNPTTQIGPCIVGVVRNNPNQGGGDNGSVSYMDFASAFTIKGPNGTRTLAKQPTGYSSMLGGTAFPGQVPVPPPPYLSPGAYTFDNGAGGKDVAPFSLTFNAPQPIVWSNADALLASGVTRSAGVDILWTPGGDPDALVSVGGVSLLPSAAGGGGGLFSCSVHDSDGHFFVPAVVLQALPASTVTNGNSTGSMTVIWTHTEKFTLPEIDPDQGTFVNAVGTTRSIVFK